MQKFTRKQVEAIKSVYDRDHSVAPSYLAFRRGALSGSFDCVMIEWKGMWLGIETDGYTHS